MTHIAIQFKEKTSIGRLLMLLLSLLLSLPLCAQQRIDARGYVQNREGLPLVGATVQVVGTTDAVVTDLQGAFVVRNVSPKAKLRISYVGYAAAEVEVRSGSMEVVLEDDRQLIEEVTVVGYGTMKKRDLTGAITSVTNSEIEKRLPTDVYEALQGQVAGVQIVTNSGAPGEGATVRVRGTATFGTGVEPLYVVDGLPVESADMVNPYDIESVEILKDAASAAIYGSRSANGVVLITTKKGSIGRTRLDLKYQMSFNHLANCIPMTTPEQFRYYDQVRMSLGEKGASTYTDPYNRFLNSGENILDQLFQTATKHQLDLSASGGTDKLKYYAGFGFIGEDGIVVNSNYKKMSMRLNFEYAANKVVRVGHRVFASYSGQNGLYSESGVLTQLYDWVPYWNLHMADGSNMHNIENRNSALAYALEATNKNQRLNASILDFVEFSLAKGLKFTTNLSGSFNLNRSQTYKPSILLGTVATDKTTGVNTGYYTYSVLNENYFNYNFKRRGHDFSAVLGNSIQYWRTDTDRITGQDYTTDEIYTVNFASQIDAKNTYATISDHSLVSFFARLTYSYAGKYLFATNMREDASSRFGKNRKWGFFPSASIGWRFSDERFMEWSRKVLTDAKIRASYGLTGNEAIGNYDSYTIYNPGSYYEGISGIAPSRLGNPDLSWESTAQTNIGVDLSFFDNRLTVTADWYDKQTTDLLYQSQLPKETGYTTITRNVGAMQNRGFEFSVNARILKHKDWSWDLAFNISRNNSVIKRLADGIPFYTGSGSAIYVQENARIGEFYGYRHDGIFQYDESNAFSSDWQQLTPVFSNGQFMHQYLLNGEPYRGEVLQKRYSDGKILQGGDVNWTEAPGSRNGIIDTDDKVKLGCAQPDFFGGLNTTLSYRGLSLFVSLYYSIGGEIYNYARKSRNSFQRTYTSPEPDVIYNMWTKEGDIATYPRPVSTVEYNRLGPSDFFIEDASYVKLRNVKLTYRLPSRITRKAGIRNMTVYVYGNNLLTFTSYRGFDPEFSGANALSFGIDSNRYPRKREYGLGLVLTF